MSSYGPFSRSTPSTVALRIVTIANHVGHSRCRFGIDTMLLVTGCLRARIDGPKSTQFMQEVTRLCAEHGWILVRCPSPSKGWALQKCDELNKFSPVAWKPEFLDLIRSLSSTVPVPVPVQPQESREDDKLREMDN